MWAFPYDPSLPGLPEATSPATVQNRISPCPSTLRVKPLRYRPRRRAVLRYEFEARDGARVLFAKVLPPARADAALRAADQLRGAGNAPLRLALPVARTGPGALLVRPLEGRSLRDLLLAGTRLPSPERVARLPDDLAGLAPPDPSSTPLPVAGRGRPRLDTAERVGELIVRLLPALAAPVGHVLDAVGRGVEGDEIPERLVHGDLYEAQVFVGRDFTLGLIDLDDLGLGDAALDAANFCAHLLALALSADAAAERLLAYRVLLRQAFLDRLDIAPLSLAWREAFAMLLLATGPFRVLHPNWPAEVARRVELAEKLLRQP